MGHGKVIDRPISVVSSDRQALVAMFAIHAVPEPRALDVTANEGRMWRGVPVVPHRMDINPTLKERGLIDTIADFRNTPFPDRSFDVIVFDPPHICDAGENGVVGGADQWGDRFGTSNEDVQGYVSVSHLFEPFLVEAKRLLLPDTGVVFAKISDQTHSAEYQWQHCDLKDAALRVGMTPCDLFVVVQLNRGGLNDPRWKHIYHARKVHSFWMVIRNGENACCAPCAPRVERYVSGPLFAEEVA